MPRAAGWTMTAEQCRTVSLGMMGNTNIGNQQGENNFYHILTNDNVLEIRSSKLKAKHFADKFGISRQHVYDIRKRRYWSHLP